MIGGTAGLEALSIGELEFRAGLCGRIAREARAAGDPRHVEAIRQQQNLNDERARRLAGMTGRPSPIVIGMRAISMKARAKHPLRG